MLWDDSSKADDRRLRPLDTWAFVADRWEWWHLTSVEIASTCDRSDPGVFAATRGWGRPPGVWPAAAVPDACAHSRPNAKEIRHGDNE